MAGRMISDSQLTHRFPGGDAPTSLSLFCRVVDNFGDIGICWRLARQLSHERGIAVTLWVDDLASFQRLAPAVQCAQAVQQVDAVTVRWWQGETDGPGAQAAVDDRNMLQQAGKVTDIVIEFFGCDIPETYIATMAQCEPRPIWLNLEGLTAEKWVEGCHLLPSPHPRLPLMKYFYFPGFNENTGGLLRERFLEQQRSRFQADPDAMANFLCGLGVTPTEMTGLKVSLFCYPHAPVTALLAAMEAADRPVTCFVPDGVAAEAIGRFLRMPPQPGAVHTQGALTVRVLPFVAQPDYDRLLWACDVNFVRGEDSFVRAQWAGRPFVWHIYPQEENLHHVKLRAFLDTHVPVAQSRAAMLLWNGAPGDTPAFQPEAGEAAAGAPSNWSQTWQAFAAALPVIEARTCAWRTGLLEQDDLATQLLRFAAARRLADLENQL
jgi:uncharacterized repeat protein (TIGR03837 family)